MEYPLDELELSLDELELSLKESDTITKYFDGELYTFVGNINENKVTSAYSHIQDKLTDKPIADTPDIYEYLVKEGNVSVWSRNKFQP